MTSAPADALTAATWVVIPAYNERGRVELVIERARKHGLRCAVVDDGSIDGTGAAARSAKADAVLVHESNLGYGAALATGLHWLARRADCRWAATLDADGQIDPADVVMLVQAAEARGAPLAVGIRPDFPRFSERVAAALIHRTCGIRDPLCGLKVYHVELLRQLPQALGRKLGMDLPVRAAKRGALIVQDAIHLSPRYDSVSRFGQGWRPALRVAAALISMLPLLIRERAA